MTDAAWWKTAAIYEVYPRSFQDSDGDGTGDLNGITSRLDYLAWLGVGAIWICPFYPSPMADFGYDVSDYTGVDPLFGTFDDFERLVAEAHARGLRVVLDFVPNHTSDQHPWFVESRSSRENDKRDWYIWRDGREDGGPPNNWLAHFGGSAWTFDDATGQYYYHAFLPQQPDLNWRNPEVRQAMLEVLRWWLDRGVDGFRVDVAWHLLKDEQLRDNPPNPEFAEAANPYTRLLEVHSADHPDVIELIAEMRAVTDSYADRVLIGEIYLPPAKLVRYYGEGGKGFHVPFNFQLVLAPWRRPAIQGAIEEYERLLPEGAWPNWVLGNHDRPRIASRAGREQTRVAAMLLLTLRGTPTLYYGDEIGMEDVPVPPSRVRDPAELRAPGLGLGRDPERSPMQWDGSRNAGFTTGEPWLPLSATAGEVNVEAQSADQWSLLSLYRALFALRRSAPALTLGTLSNLAGEGDVLAFERNFQGVRLLIVLNLGGKAATWHLREPGEFVLSTGLDRSGPTTGELQLRAHEGVIVRPEESASESQAGEAAA